MWRKTAGTLLMLLLCLCTVFLCKGDSVNAAITGAAEDYELGETYEGKILEDEEVRYFRFTIPEKSHVTLYMECNGGREGGTLYNEAGKEVMRKTDLNFETNFFTGYSRAQLSRTLSAGTYFLGIENGRKWKWQEYKFSFCIQAERQIKLAKGILNYLESLAEGQFTVKCEAVENAIGYRIQYSTDEQLKKGVTTIDSPAAVKTIKKLKKGERYYVKVRPYTVYDDGTYVYGENSYVKTVVVRKKRK